MVGDHRERAPHKESTVNLQLKCIDIFVGVGIEAGIYAAVGIQSGDVASKRTGDLKKKLLSEDSWKRDAMLMETAQRLRVEPGDGLFEDHNVFLDQLDGALGRLGIRLGAPDKKQILNAVS